MSDETKTVTYTVQRAVDGLTAVDEKGREIPMDTAWVDIATVEVPVRTKRKSVFKQALKDAGIKPDGSALKLRALDAESAEVVEPTAITPEPEWSL